MRVYNPYLVLMALTVIFSSAREVTNPIQGPGYTVLSNDGSQPSFLKVHTDAGTTYLDTFFCIGLDWQCNCRVAPIPENECFAFGDDYVSPTLDSNGLRILSWTFPKTGEDACVGYQDKSCETRGHSIPSSKIGPGFGGDLTGILGLEGGFVSVKCVWKDTESLEAKAGDEVIERVEELINGSGTKPGYVGP